jgi:energy-coupling factor transporter ATP-binding protein EcfA2
MDSNKKIFEALSSDVDEKNSADQKKDFSDVNNLNTQPNSTEQISQPLDGINILIEDIVKKRQELANRVKPVHSYLSLLGEEIAGLEQRRQQLILTIDDAEVDKKLETINLSDLKKRVEQEAKELEKVIGRFSRSTLNIGVVGRMGQGKSTFLKSLSGLSDNEIPAHEGGACTAVRSKIFHHNGDTDAIVTYHSKSTFIEEVIGEYYRELELGSLNTLEDFANTTLRDSPRSATHEEMYKRLKEDYHTTYQHYSPLLQDGLPRQMPIDKQDIPRFVAQQRDAHNRLTSFDHLAVREVEIRCHFPKVEVHRLGLVDVPGLGDTRVADEKLILKTLEQEVDVVLFFRKPDVDRYQWEKDDFKLYDIAVKALDNLNNRAFMVLNHRKYGSKDNLNGCNSLKSNTQSIKVVDPPIIADCSNPNDVNAVLDLVLKYLDKNIIAIEEQYARSCQSRLFEVYNLINAELEKAQSALISYVGESRQFEVKFKEIIDALAEGLNNLLEDLWKQHDSADSNFESVVNNALQQCENDTGIPSEQEINRLSRLPEYKNRYEIVHSVCSAELRSHLSKNFLALDQGLKNASDKLKCLIANVLISEGVLGELAKALDVKDIEFLEAMRKTLEVRQNRLEIGFRTLLDFKMSYGALIMESIRKDLERVLGGVRASSRPDASPSNVVITGAEVIKDLTSSAPEPWAGLPEVDKIKTGMEIVGNVANVVTSNFALTDAASVSKSLKFLHRKAVDECKQTLQDWVKAPSRLRYYMAEEFVDRILYDEGVKEEWRHFLSDDNIRSRVWIEFKQIEDRKHVQADWLNAVKRVGEFNQQKRLEFIS